MLATRCEPQYSQLPVQDCANPGEGYADSSRIMCSDASTVEFVGPSHQAQTPVSSFDFSSAPFVLQSSRAAFSSSNSVVSSSSLVSVCSGEDEPFPSSSDYYRAGEQPAIPIFSKEELKILSRCLPHTKIKKIIKCSGAVNHMIGSEVPALLAIACELFKNRSGPGYQVGLQQGLQIQTTLESKGRPVQENPRSEPAAAPSSPTRPHGPLRQGGGPPHAHAAPPTHKWLPFGRHKAFPSFSADPANKDADPPLSVPRATQGPHVPGPPASS
ncbi:CCAAT-binding factor chain HAP5 like histone [Cryptosporidium canis]|uniref:CCAAT-binding factor chain HAP5 like histone n=1 Tax=Cryptosporidium canis TaxID=195482 RepID=A0A9D5DHP9_9CRYT|nr:CCAAT-binding factor chain HAP5 like histone [Cryptosporidium canis]